MMVNNSNTDIDSVMQKLEKIKSITESISNASDKGQSNSNYLSANQFGSALSSMQQYANLQKEILSNLDAIQNKAAQSGNPMQQQMASQLKNGVQQNYQQVQQNYNGIAGMTTGNNAGMNYRNRMNNAFGSDNDYRRDMSNLSDERSYTRRLVSRQNSRYDSAMSTGHMTSEGLDSFNMDSQNGMQRLNNYQNNVASQIDKYTTQANTLTAQNTALKQDPSIDKETMLSQIGSNNAQIDEATKIVTKLKDFQTELDKSVESLKKYDSGLQDSDVSVSAQRGTFSGYISQRSPSIAYHTVGAATSTLSSLASAGEQLNSSTDDQSINLGYATGVGTDQSVRDQMFNINQKRSNGYSLQDSLNYYQLAIERNRYNGGGNSTNSSMVNEMELAGNNTGIGRSDYTKYATAVMNSGAVSNTADLTTLDNSVTGMNVYARTAGMQQQQATTLTNLVNQNSKYNTISKADIEGLAATEGILAKNGGRTLQGTQGERALGEWNNSYVSASEGGNSKLLQMKIMSNPSKYGGLKGVVNAESDLSKGLSSSSNIALAKQMSDIYGGANGGGALVLQNLFGVKGIKSAKQIAKVLDDGDLSDSQREKAIKNIQDEGTSKRKKNQKTYNSSTTATRNQKTAQKDRQESQVDSASEKTLGRIQTAVGSLPTWMSTIIGLLGTMAVSLGGQALSGAVSSKLSKAGESSVGKGTASGETRTGKYTSEARSKSRSDKFYSKHSKLKKVRDKAKSTRDSLTGKYKDSKLGKGVEKVLRRGKHSSKMPSRLGKLGDIASKGGKVLGRANAIAMVASAGMEYYSDVKSKHPVKNAAKTTGGLAGGIAGAEGGAAIGAAIPVLGETGIGELGGGIIGGLAGGGVGSWITNKITGLFSSKKAKASTISKKKKSELRKKEKEKEKRKKKDKKGDLDKAENSKDESTAYQNERQNEKNIRNQKENYEYYNRLLIKAKELLEQAKKQGGIVGKTSSTKSSSSSSSGTPSYNSKGKKASEKSSSSSALKDVAKAALSTVVSGLGISGILASTAGNILSETTSSKKTKHSSKKTKHNANGSISNKETLSWLSEGDSQEAIVPLDVDKRNEPRSQALANVVNQAYNQKDFSNTTTSSGTTSTNKVNMPINVNIDSIDSKSDADYFANKLNTILKEKMSNGISDNSTNYSVINGLS